MEKIIIHPTETSQWHALLNEAQIARSCQLDEALESYLVFLLMRYTAQPQLISSVLAFDYFASQQNVGQLRIEQLRELGDKSLLFSGLFPGLAQRRRVSLRYFIEMGQAAYGTVSCLEGESWSEVFAALADEFILLTEVLSIMRRTEHFHVDEKISRWMASFDNSSAH